MSESRYRGQAAPELLGALEEAEIESLRETFSLAGCRAALKMVRRVLWALSELPLAAVVSHATDFHLP